MSFGVFGFLEFSLSIVRITHHLTQPFLSTLGNMLRIFENLIRLPNPSIWFIGF